MDQETQAKVQLWKDNVEEPDLKSELDELLSGDEEKLNDAFYRNLAFGTAGLRGVLGVGSNRMNVYNVAQATQGVADYLNAHYDHPTLALARDSRLKGEDFQRVAAGVLAANGVHVFVYPRIEEVMAAPEMSVPEHPQRPADFSIEFRDARFSYAGADAPAIDGISFKVPASSTFALVGPSGGGKTTAASLIPRFWDVDEGP